MTRKSPVAPPPSGPTPDVSPVVGELQAATDKRVPFVLLVTGDAPNAQTLVVQAMAEQPDGTSEIPAFSISTLLGLIPLNKAGENATALWLEGADPSMFADLASFIRRLASAPGEATIVWWGADRAWSDPAIACALSQVRDVCSARGVTLVGLGSGPLTGGDLGSDVYTIRDDPPDDRERSRIITRLCADNEIEVDPPTITQATNVSRGLNRFSVQQVTGLATRGARLDLAVMVSRWREQLAGLPGVSVERAIPLDWYGGNAAWLDYLRAFVGAGVSLVVQLDEIEKTVPSADSRDAGASASILGELLTHLNDSEPAGAIAEGIPGTGKSLSALAAGTLFQCPVIRINPGKMKGGIVGESERNAARVFALLRSFGGLQFWVATSNRLDTVPEELSDRFPGGVWFFDLPTGDELPLIWRANLLRYGFDPSDRWADDSGWTGRDVRAVCLEARRTRQTIAAVAAQRIPGSRRMATRIQRMRDAARAEAYRSATTGQAYAGPSTVVQSSPVKLRTRGAAPAPTNPEPDTF